MKDTIDIFLSSHDVNILREWTIEQTLSKFLEWLVQCPLYRGELKHLENTIKDAKAQFDYEGD